MDSCSSPNQTRFIELDGSKNYSLLDDKFLCSQYYLNRVPLNDLLQNKLLPIVIIFTAVTNILISIVLTRRHMVTPTNIILLGMAITDLCTGVMPLPIYIAKNFSGFSVHVTVFKSYLDSILVTVCPTVFHTMSMWLTVYLAIQRFIYISLPARVDMICTERNSIIATVTIFILCISQAPGFIYKFMVYNRLCLDSGSLTKVVTKCNIISFEVMTAYYYFRTIFAVVLPCLILSIFTILLLIALKKAEAKRRRLLKSSRKESGRMKENNSTSKMLIVVLIIFLVVELPNGALIAIYVINKNFDLQLNWDWDKYTNISNFCVLLSYPANFFVYCLMSQQFRNTFRNLFGCGIEVSREGGYQRTQNPHVKNGTKTQSDDL